MAYLIHAPVALGYINFTPAVYSGPIEIAIGQAWVDVSIQTDAYHEDVEVSEITDEPSGCRSWFYAGEGVVLAEQLPETDYKAFSMIAEACDDAGDVTADELEALCLQAGLDEQTIDWAAGVKYKRADYGNQSQFQNIMNLIRETQERLEMTYDDFVLFFGDADEQEVTDSWEADPEFLELSRISTSLVSCLNLINPVGREAF